MPDIFLSYNREDQATARRFAEAFQAEGLEVWWDTTLRAGEAYDEVTEAALNDAKAVVVLWSPRSVVSRWVRAEATQADRNKTLVPVTVEACRRPIMFELTQTADLTGWDGSASDGAWLGFLADVKRFVQAARPPSGEPLAAPPAAPATAARPERLSICVLPFANMSDDAQQEYFSDGISEDIITDLSKVSALFVIARNTAFTFKGKSVGAPQIARQLNISHVLEGSVRKAGNRVRITAQLIDGATGGHLWADRFDRDLDDIFALQDEISEAIVKALKLKLLPEEKTAIEDRGTTNLEAYDAYLRARKLFDVANTSPDFLRARDLFQQALAMDAGFAQARGGLAYLYWVMMIYVPETRDQALEDLEDLAREALVRAPEHWASHLTNGIHLAARRRELPAALAALERAVALSSSTDIYVRLVFATCLGAVGRVRHAIRFIEASRSSDPLSTGVSLNIQQLCYVEGRSEEAAAEYDRTLDLPGYRGTRELFALFRVWDAGDMERTKDQFRRYLESQVVRMPEEAKLIELLTQPAAALELLHGAFKDPANQDGTRMLLLGWYAGRFGDADLAVAALQRADLIGAAIWVPFLSTVRKTPAFKQLVRDAGVYDYWRASGEWGDFARPVGDDDFEIIR